MRNLNHAIVLIATGCTGPELPDKPPSCESTVSDTFSIDDGHVDIDFTAQEVAEVLTAWSEPTGTAMGDGRALAMSLHTTSTVLGTDAEVVRYDGDEGCPKGDALRIEVTMTTSGTVEGLELSGSRTATVDALDLHESRIVFVDGASESYDAVLDPELAALLSSTSEHPDLDSPADTWRWQVGPEVNRQSTWAYSVERGEITVRTPDTAEGSRVKLVDYGATVAGLTTTPGG
jgi:hypothetical protein